MSNAPQFIELGYIAGAFGVRGEVRVHLHGDVLDSVLLDQPQCWVKPSARTGKKGDWQALEIAQIKAHGNSLVVRFRAISNRDQAADLQGYTLALPREAFPEQEEEDTFYWVDLIGCEVRYDPDIEAEEDVEDDFDADALPSMGFVREVSENGVHAILHVCAQDESGAWRTNAKGRPLDQLIPFVAPIVPFVDIDEGLIITNYPPEADAEDAS